MNRFARGGVAFVAACSLAVAACSSDSTSELETQDEVSSRLDSDVVDERADGTTSPDDDAATVDESADAPADEAPVTEVDPDAVVPEGFSTVTVEITKADGTVCEVCMWLADSDAERGQGLMGVTSLGAADGMAFVWEQPTSGAFFMFQTVTPLSIAWFAEPSGVAAADDDDAGGALVSTAEMEPCLGDDSSRCERFGPGGDYVLAVEVFQGDLGSVGITDGAAARILPGTEASDCPLA